MAGLLPRVLLVLVLASPSAFVLSACTNEDNDGSSPGTGAEAGATPSSGDGGTPSPDPTAPDGDDGDAGDAGDAGATKPGRGIVVDVDGTRHELATSARVISMGNGYGIQANKVDGTKLYGVTVQLVQATNNGGPASYVVPSPGTYACSATVPTAPYQWARIQYTSPDGTYQYGNGAACVTVTEFGAVGQPVKGTFVTTLDRVTNNGPPSVQVSGTFDVDRQN